MHSARASSRGSSTCTPRKTQSTTCRGIPLAMVEHADATSILRCFTYQRQWRSSLKSEPPPPTWSRCQRETLEADASTMRPMSNQQIYNLKIKQEKQWRRRESKASGARVVWRRLTRFRHRPRSRRALSISTALHRALFRVVSRRSTVVLK